MLVAVFCFQAMGLVAKWLAADFSVVQIVFFRSLFGLFPIVVLLFRTRSVGALKTSRPFAHVSRGMLGLVGISGWFFAIAIIPIADATAINFTGPLFIAALSVPFLGERVGPRLWLAILIGFAGSLLMIQPAGGAALFGSLLALIGALGYAGSMIVTRTLGRTEASGAIVFYNTLTVTVVYGLALPFYWTTPGWTDLALFVVMGAVGGTGQWWQTKAFTLAPASIVSPLNYTALIWSTLFGYLIWSDLPGPATIIGAFVVVGSGLYILHRETRKDR